MDFITMKNDVKENDNESPIPKDVVDHLLAIEKEINSKLIVPQEDQAISINQKEKKTYDRDFLVMQDDSSTRIKPTNLPDVEALLKDWKKQQQQHDSKNHNFEINIYILNCYDDI